MDVINTRLLGLLGIVSMCAGCASTDPMVSETGRWTPTGANDANLVAEIANPGDLVRGRGMDNADGQMAATAVQRLRQGHVKALPDNDLSDIKVSGSGGPAATPADNGSP